MRFQRQCLECEHDSALQPARTISADSILYTCTYGIAAATGGVWRSAPAAEPLAAAKADGIKERTLDRAKRSPRIKSKFIHVSGEHRAWLWCPPREPDRGPLDPLPYDIGPVDDPIRRDLPKDLSKEAGEILDRERLAWARENLRRGD